MRRSPIATAGWSLAVLIAGALAGCAGTSAPGAAPAPGADSLAVAAPAKPAEESVALGDLAPAQFRVLASASAYWRGDAKAPVTIVEFGDYDCPYCAEEQPVLEKILADYRGRVRLVFLVYPLGHPHSGSFAQAARCAGEQGGFWKMHDYIFGHYGQLDDSHLGLYASGLGLDGEALASCIESGRYRKSIESDHALARRVGVTGTPTFFVNGTLLDGAQNYGQFARAIDEALEAADRPAARRGG